MIFLEIDKGNVSKTKSSENVSENVPKNIVRVFKPSIKSRDWVSNLEGVWLSSFL